MSKNSLKSCKFVAVAHLAIAMLLSSNAVRGQQPLQNPEKDFEAPFHVRYQVAGGNYVDDFLYIPCDAYHSGREGDGSTWDDVKYTTSKHSLPDNPRFLSHFMEGILAYPILPPTAIFVHAGTLYSVNVVEAVDEFWGHHMYGGYTKVPNSTSPSMNCHGYSTGVDYWLEDFQKLVDDDWEAPNDSLRDLFDYVNHPGRWVVYGDEDHSARINNITWTWVDYPTKVKCTFETSEKNQGSAIYHGAFDKLVFNPTESPKVELDMDFLLELDTGGYGSATFFHEHFYKRK